MNLVAARSVKRYHEVVRRALELAVEQHLADSYGVIDRRQAMDLGMSRAQVDGRLRAGRWLAVHRCVYARAVPALDWRGRLLAACLAAGPGALASHSSAASVWGLLPRPAVFPTVTVPAARHPRIVGAMVRRSQNLDLDRSLIHLGIPVTDPLRTLADLGEVVADDDLDWAVDQALVRRRLTVEALHAEVRRLQGRGRRGVGRLRASLQRRGLVEAPAPSMLESRVLRLLHAWEIVPASVETTVCGGYYRVDVMLRPGLALEVDGYGYHWSPEAKAGDARRHNAIQVEGTLLVLSDWITVLRRPHVLRAEVLAALAAWERRRRVAA
jgi:hypothetical protein